MTSSLGQFKRFLFYQGIAEVSKLYEVGLQVCVILTHTCRVIII